MSENTFIGIGKNPNPNVPDLPLGLGMALAQTPSAMERFSNLSDEEKTQLINYIQSSVTGEDAKHRISETVQQLTT